MGASQSQTIPFNSSLKQKINHGLTYQFDSWLADLGHQPDSTKLYSILQISLKLNTQYYKLLQQFYTDYKLKLPNTLQSAHSLFIKEFNDVISHHFVQTEDKISQKDLKIQSIIENATMITNELKVQEIKKQSNTQTNESSQNEQNKEREEQIANMELQRRQSVRISYILKQVIQQKYQSSILQDSQKKLSSQIQQLNNIINEYKKIIISQQKKLKQYQKSESLNSNQTVKLPSNQNINEVKKQSNIKYEDSTQKDEKQCIKQQKQQVIKEEGSLEKQIQLLNLQIKDLKMQNLLLKIQNQQFVVQRKHFQTKVNVFLTDDQDQW